jgi:hypothetical protein
MIYVQLNINRNNKIDRRTYRTEVVRLQTEIAQKKEQAKNNYL